MFWKTTDKLCFLLAQDCADKLLWSLTPKLPKCRGWCAVKAVHRIVHRYGWLLSHDSLLPATADTSNVRVVLTRQPPTGSTFQERGTYVWRVKELSSVFIQFCEGCIHTHRKISHQKLILGSKRKARFLTNYFRQNCTNWKCLWGARSVNGSME